MAKTRNGSTLSLYLALCLFMSTGAAQAAPVCRAKDARYLSNDGRLSAWFQSVGRRPGWPSDLALAVKSPGRTDWFLFDRGSARYVNLVSTTNVSASKWRPPSPDGGIRPLGEMHYIAIDRRLDVDEAVPMSVDKAPFGILLPDLAEVLAHRASPPVSIRTSFLILRGCGTARG